MATGSLTALVVCAPLRMALVVVVGNDLSVWVLFGRCSDVICKMVRLWSGCCDVSCVLWLRERRRVFSCCLVLIIFFFFLDVSLSLFFFFLPFLLLLVLPCFSSVVYFLEKKVWLCEFCNGCALFCFAWSSLFNTWAEFYFQSPSRNFLFKGNTTTKTRRLLSTPFCTFFFSTYFAALLPPPPPHPTVYTLLAGALLICLFHFVFIFHVLSGWLAITFSVPYTYLYIHVHTYKYVRNGKGHFFFLCWLAFFFPPLLCRAKAKRLICQEELALVHEITCMKRFFFYLFTCFLV